MKKTTKPSSLNQFQWDTLLKTKVFILVDGASKYAFNSVGKELFEI